MLRTLKTFSKIVSKLYFLTAPYSRKKPIIVLVVTLIQGVFQVIGVTSIFPFLAIASDPSGFRNSTIGEFILGHWPKVPDSTLLIFAGIFSIAMLVAANGINLASDYVRARYGQGLAHWLRRRLLTEIVSQPWSYFLGNNSGVLLKKATSDVMQMTIGVLFPFLEGLSRFVTLAFLTITLLIVDPVISICALLVLSFYYLGVFSFLKARYAKASAEQKIAYAGAMKEAQQMLGGIKPIKIQNAEKHFMERFSNHSDSQARVNARLPIYYQAPKYILEPIAFGGMITIVLVQISLGKEFTSLLPSLGVIALAGYRMLPAAQILYAQISRIATQRHALEEVYDEFEQQRLRQATMPSAASAFTTPQPLHWSREIRIDDLTFAYPGSKGPIVENFSLTIPHNQTVGIIGTTGSGKSTLVDLILGLHEPSSGAIRVDGKRLEFEDMRAWRAGIGYVPQDVFLIDDTLARNIALGLPDEMIDQTRLREVAAAARILTFIEDELTEGFDTEIGERGIRLSGGQKQRIAIARALYHRPSLLILDEATSALDESTENAVTEAITSLQGSVTMIIVAHRLSTIKSCSIIVDLGSEGSTGIRTSTKAEKSDQA